MQHLDSSSFQYCPTMSSGRLEWLARQSVSTGSVGVGSEPSKGGVKVPQHTPIRACQLTFPHYTCPYTRSPRSTLAKTLNNTASQFFAWPLRYLRFSLLSSFLLSFSSPWVWTCVLDSTTLLNARKIGGGSVGLAYISFVSRSPSSRPNALERSGGLEQYAGRVYQR